MMMYWVLCCFFCCVLQRGGGFCFNIYNGYEKLEQKYLKALTNLIKIPSFYITSLF